MGLSWWSVVCNRSLVRWAVNHSGQLTRRASRQTKIRWIRGFRRNSTSDYISLHPYMLSSSILFPIRLGYACLVDMAILFCSWRVCSFSGVQHALVRPPPRKLEHRISPIKHASTRWAKAHPDRSGYRPTEIPVCWKPSHFSFFTG